jgi:hypothetical protein
MSELFSGTREVATTENHNLFYRRTDKQSQFRYHLQSTVHYRRRWRHRPSKDNDGRDKYEMRRINMSEAEHHDVERI